MKSGLTDKRMSIHSRWRALDCYNESILMYGCKVWTISKQIQKKKEPAEMRITQRMLWSSWTAKKSNDTVLREADTTKWLINWIRKRQTTFLGHVMRRKKPEHHERTGISEAKGSRGNQCEKTFERLTKWLNVKRVTDPLNVTRDLHGWRLCSPMAYCKASDLLNVYVTH